MGMRKTFLTFFQTSFRCVVSLAVTVLRYVTGARTGMKIAIRDECELAGELVMAHRVPTLEDACSMMCSGTHLRHFRLIFFFASGYLIHLCHCTRC